MCCVARICVDVFYVFVLNYSVVSMIVHVNLRLWSCYAMFVDVYCSDGLLFVTYVCLNVCVCVVYVWLYICVFAFNVVFFAGVCESGRFCQSAPV